MANDLQSFPCVLMRGGTSKGPFFLKSDLPDSLAERDRVLVSVMGSGHPLQIDGIGGGDPLSSKVAIISRSESPLADIDYLFAQVNVKLKLVDTTPNCGNMLSAVAPFAIEAGLVTAGDPVTTVRINNVNTNKIIEATVQTPGKIVQYLGDAAIDGVPGRAAPIALSFVDAAGAVTGELLPTGQASEIIDGVRVTCIDCAMPMVLVSAEDLGITGGESARELDANVELVARLQRIRIEGGRRMGIENPEDKVIPKPVIISRPSSGGTLRVRYFLPLQCHSALSSTGSVGLATACVTPGTIAADMVGAIDLPAIVKLEHPSGQLGVSLDQISANAPIRAGIMRTARRLFEGRVYASLSAAEEDQHETEKGTLNAAAINKAVGGKR